MSTSANSNTDAANSAPKQESAGLVVADSLAAESLSAGGGFTGGAASSVPARATTANNTDTSAASVLEPAPDAEARQATEDWDEAAQLNAGRRVAEKAVEPAQRSLPKVTDLKEGGFDSDGPNASFNQAVGTNKDPAREALAGMLKSGARSGGDAGAPKDSQVSRDGQYDVLKDTEA